MIFIVAYNVNSGGGLILLEELLVGIPNNQEFVLYADSRVNIKFAHNINVKKVNPSLISRFKAELEIRSNSREKDLVFCFGNFPPLFNLKAFVTVFFQNRILVDNTNISNFKFKKFLRLFFERIIFKFIAIHADEYIVQSESMRDLLIKNIKNIPTRVSPFTKNFNFSKKKTHRKQDVNKYVFIYPASLDPHKNHINLVMAWKVLLDKKLKPKLLLTTNKALFLKEFSELTGLVSVLNISFVGHVSHEILSKIYSESDCLIYPSISESYGLPLVECNLNNMPIIASELDFVRDVCNPVETFNPNSSRSIAAAVARFLGRQDRLTTPLTGKSFMFQYLNRK
jgi:glycosyltransferase involved in cell wall biosynthesis